MLSIGTKIVKGQIELTSDFPSLKVGSNVSSSVQALLQKLGLKPFNFGMEVHGVFQDGAVFDAAVLDIKSDVLVTKFMARIAIVAAFGQEVGIPSEAGMSQMFANGFKMLLRLFLTSTTSTAKVGLRNAVILAIAIGIFLKLGQTKQFPLLASFLLARVAEYQAVWSVAHALHTPLMSVTNAISGMTAGGALLLLKKFTKNHVDGEPLELDPSSQHPFDSVRVGFVNLSCQHQWWICGLTTDA